MNKIKAAFNNIKAYIKKNYPDIFKPIVVLLAICIVIPLALSVTNKITADRIAELQIKLQKEAMEKLIDADEYVDSSIEADGEKISYNKALKENEAIGYLFVTSSKGYGGGEISVMTAITPDKKIKEISILDATSQTPGLGQNVSKEKFYSQFNEKTNSITVKKNGAKPELNEVDSVTGATISSKAVANAVNQALKNFDMVLEAEKEVAASEE